MENRRNRFSTFGLMALTAVALWGCKGIEEPATGEVGVGPGQQQHDHFIDGVPATRFYQELTYKKLGNHSMPYFYLSGDWEFLERFPNGNLFFRVALFLKRDGKYGLVYEESLGFFSGGEFQEKARLYREVVDGSWSIDKIELRLGELARGSGNLQNGESKLTLRFLKDLNNGGLIGYSYGLSAKGHAESPQDRARTLVDLGEFDWLKGKWESKSSKDEFSVDPKGRKFELKIYEKVGGLENAVYPWSIQCRYEVHARDLRVYVYFDRYDHMKYKLEYLPSRYKLISDGRNDHRCGDYIKAENEAIPGRTWYSVFEFQKLDDEFLRGPENRTYELDKGILD